MPTKENRSSDNHRIRDGMKHLILCEGRDEWNFLVSYLNSKALEERSEYSGTIQVEDFGGNEELPTKLMLWVRAPGFENLKSLIVIRDAESSAETASNCVIRAFEKAGLPVPTSPHHFVSDEKIKTGFLLFPECSSELRDGTLEDLCLSILEENDDAVLNEVETFLSDLESRCVLSFPRRFKAKLHTYFSIEDKYVSLKIGEAAKAGAFNWYSSNLNQIKSFLSEMIQQGIS